MNRAEQRFGDPTALAFLVLGIFIFVLLRDEIIPAVDVFVPGVDVIVCLTFVVVPGLDVIVPGVNVVVPPPDVSVRLLDVIVPDLDGVSGADAVVWHTRGHVGGRDVSNNGTDDHVDETLYVVEAGYDHVEAAIYVVAPGADVVEVRDDECNAANDLDATPKVGRGRDLE